MAGYWRQPELTAEMLKDGPVPGERMLCTHDFFTIDEDGFLYFVGRSDDIIKTRGEKVSPLEVENALYAIGGVREAAVDRRADDVLGEAIRAYVVLEDGVELDRAGSDRRRAGRRLESFMVPRRGRLPRRAAEDDDRQDPQEGPRRMSARLRGALRTLVDPGTYFQAVRLLHYYGYSHVGHAVG